MSGVAFVETDYGSKGRAKAAAKGFSIEVTKEAKWRLKAWWFRVKETARALCPVDTGTLQATIRIQEKGLAMEGGYPFEVVYAPQNELISSEIIAGGMLINPKTGRIVDYAQAVHDGHFTRGGKFTPPQPFLQNAINLHIKELDKILGDAIKMAESKVWIGD